MLWKVNYILGPNVFPMSIKQKIFEIKHLKRNCSIVIMQNFYMFIMMRVKDKFSVITDYVLFYYQNNGSVGLLVLLT